MYAINLPAGLRLLQELGSGDKGLGLEIWPMRGAH